MKSFYFSKNVKNTIYTILHRNHIFNQKKSEAAAEASDFKILIRHYSAITAFTV